MKRKVIKEVPASAEVLRALLKELRLLVAEVKLRIDKKKKRRGPNRTGAVKCVPEALTQELIRYKRATPERRKALLQRPIP